MGQARRPDPLRLEVASGLVAENGAFISDRMMQALNTLHQCVHMNVFAEVAPRAQIARHRVVSVRVDGKLPVLAGQPGREVREKFAPSVAESERRLKPLDDARRAVGESRV